MASTRKLVNFCAVNIIEKIFLDMLNYLILHHL